MSLLAKLRERQRDSIYVPLQCQVHTCSKPSVAYCGSTYVFVCAAHKAEFCDPEKHHLYPITEGLEQVIRETEGVIRSNLHHNERLTKELAAYREHLKQVKP